MKDNCPSAIEWHGYRINSTTVPTVKAYISYETCEDKADVVDTCEHQIPLEGLENFASGSWTEYDSLLVLTILKPIVAFTPTNFYVPIDLGVRVPAAGLGEAFTVLDIDVWDVESNTRMNPVSVDIADSIGSFSKATLFCDEFSPGMPVSLTIRFTPLMRIAGGESVFCILEGFESETSRMTVSSEPGNFGAAYWVGDSETLRLTASQALEKDVEMVVNIPKMRLPAQGISPRSVMWIYTDAKDGGVPRDAALPIVSLSTAGALWNTAVSFEPQVFDEDLQVTVEFQPKMLLKAGDSVKLVMEGFTGPSTKGANDKFIGLAHAEPPHLFNAYWRNDDDGLPAVIVIIDADMRLPADTYVKLVIPSNCTFRDAAMNCENEPGISWSSADGEYDPTNLWLSVLSPNACGYGCDRVLDKALVRISSVLASSALQALSGTWTGSSYAASGFIQESNVTHLMECLSSGFQCPSRAAYRCETIASDVTFISDGSRARILHAMKSREIEQLGETYDSAYRGGDFELISMSGHELKMKNVTESEYLVDDDPTNTIDTDGSTFCSFARSVYRVDLDGNYDIALELYTEYVFQSLSASSTYIRLRLNITADSYFNPVGLELSDETLRSVFREAFSKTWGVPPENVIYSSSIRYLCASIYCAPLMIRIS